MKEERLTVRMAAPLRAKLNNFASNRNVGLSEAMRVLIDHGLSDRYISNVEVLVQQFASLLLDLRRVGVNVNQIAHQLNTRSHIDDSIISQELKSLRPLLDDASQLAKEVSNELNN